MISESEGISIGSGDARPTLDATLLLGSLVGAISRMRSLFVATFDTVMSSPWVRLAVGACLGVGLAVAASDALPLRYSRAVVRGTPVSVSEKAIVPGLDTVALIAATSLDTVSPNVLASAPGSAAARVARFRYDLRAFAADLMATGWVSPMRARYISYWAVTEAYRQGVPPALVLAVMSVEDDSYKSQARSGAGAVGLMQVMPRVWLGTLGPTYGWNLENDRTNVAMGIHILAENLRSQNGDWYHALLRYNGCVRGTRTSTCFSYPMLVQRALQRRARWSCPGGNFNVCVERPLDNTFLRSGVASRLLR